MDRAIEKFFRRSYLSHMAKTDVIFYVTGNKHDRNIPHRFTAVQDFAAEGPDYKHLE